MEKYRPDRKDVVVGISASGRTAYTIGALRSARSKRAATIARLGRVYSDQMVHLQMSNTKLFKRGIEMVQRIAGVEREAAMTALEWAGWHVPLALLVLCSNLSRKEAEQRLKRAGGNLRRALED